MASGQEELLFGRLALHYKLITAGQVEEVHGLHALAGGRRRLPEILVEMGYLSQRQVDQLLVVQHDYLEKRRAAQAAAAAAAAAESPAAAAAAARFESPATVPILPDSPAARGAAAPALAPPRAAAPLGAAAVSYAAPHAPAASAAGSDDTVAVPGGPAATATPWAGRAAGQRQLDAVLALAVERGASDIHIHSGAPI